MEDKKQIKSKEDDKNIDSSLHFGLLVAHQLKSPVSSASSILKTLLGDYAGELNVQQKELLSRADKRVTEAINTVTRMLSIVNPEISDSYSGTVTEAAKNIRRTILHHEQEVGNRGIIITTEIKVEPAYVRIGESVFVEIINSLLNNALKYTPDNGKICVSLEKTPAEECFTIAVADSGIGVHEDYRKKIFEPFFRASSAQDTTLPGVGLGLAFVKAVVEAAGGRIWVDKSVLGGAVFYIALPIVADTDIVPKADDVKKDRKSIVIIGGVAAGPKVASKVIRLEPETSVTVVEKGDFLAYAGCGLPYYVSGVVKEQKELMATPLGCVRDPIFFQNIKSVKVLNRTEAVEIDRKSKEVVIKNLFTGKKSRLRYDKLALATGAKPVKPKIDGINLKNIFTLHGVHDAEGVKIRLSESKARDVVIVGGGLIGVEMTEALVERGCRVTIIEMQNQILTILDWEIAKLVDRHMESHGVRILTETKAESFLGREYVEAVVTNKGTIATDMVILAVGVRPEVGLAKNAGLEIGVTGAIKVDDRMATSDPDIYAAGDCVESIDILTGKPCYVPLGSTANKQGRLAAINICGGDERFPGIIGTTICKVFDYCVARTGLTEEEAKREGFDVVTVLTGSPDREHFMPHAKTLMLKLVVDIKSRKLLGVQAVGPGQGAKRIDVAAAAIISGMTVDQVSNLDLCYAPPYSLAMDNLITGANIAKNKLAGNFESITPVEVYSKIKKKEDFILLDVSTPREYETERLPNSILIPSGALRGRIDEIPRDKDIVVFCRLSIRGYEAALALKAAGYKRVKVMDGGVEMWPYEKVYGI